jgi:hypothetical protein
MAALGHSRRFGFVRFRVHCGHEFLRQGRDGPILLKKSVDVADQILSASWKRFLNYDAEGRMAERRRDVRRSKSN